MRGGKGSEVDSNSHAAFECDSDASNSSCTVTFVGEELEDGISSSRTSSIINGSGSRIQKSTWMASGPGTGRLLGLGNS